ncbi:MAG TPA: hypothetical protein VGQ82_03610, partial [Chthoniobacterales bacterium]|nr:hypothetical protein [Chthoniobacterales bacterium]
IVFGMFLLASFWIDLRISAYGKAMFDFAVLLQFPLSLVNTLLLPRPEDAVGLPLVPQYLDWFMQVFANVVVGWATITTLYFAARVYRTNTFLNLGPRRAPLGLMLWASAAVGCVLIYRLIRPFGVVDWVVRIDSHRSNDLGGSTVGIVAVFFLSLCALRAYVERRHLLAAIGSIVAVLLFSLYGFRGPVLQFLGTLWLCSMLLAGSRKRSRRIAVIGGVLLASFFVVFQIYRSATVQVSVDNPLAVIFERFIGYEVNAKVWSAVASGKFLPTIDFFRGLYEPFVPAGVLGHPRIAPPGFRIVEAYFGDVRASSGGISLSIFGELFVFGGILLQLLVLPIFALYLWITDTIIVMTPHDAILKASLTITTFFLVESPLSQFVWVLFTLAAVAVLFSSSSRSPRRLTNLPTLQHN